MYKISSSDFKTIRVEHLGLTQLQLAKILDVSSNTISRFEIGSIPIDVRTSLSLLFLLSRSGVIHSP